MRPGEAREPVPDDAARARADPQADLRSGRPACAGTLKRSAADFLVEELPLYAPSGQGPHVLLALRRSGFTTDEVVRRLAALFGVVPRSIGVAGRKDKHAVATQQVSLELQDEPQDVARRIADALPFEVLAAARHRNKLKRGHLLGNRFELVVRDVAAAALAGLEQRADGIAHSGFANRFGPQRHGRDGANAARGRALLAAPRRRRALDDLMLSAWQASLFERWIDARLALGAIERPLAGDLLRVAATGGLFASEDLALEAERAARGELTPTGPLFGARMRRPAGAADELERALLAAERISDAALAAARLPGTRRAARVVPGALVVAREADTVRLAFTLDKGAFATVLVEALLGPLHDASAP